MGSVTSSLQRAWNRTVTNFRSSLYDSFILTSITFGALTFLSGFWSMFLPSAWVDSFEFIGLGGMVTFGIAHMICGMLTDTVYDLMALSAGL